MERSRALGKDKLPTQVLAWVAAPIQFLSRGCCYRFLMFYSMLLLPMFITVLENLNVSSCSL